MSRVYAHLKAAREVFISCPQGPTAVSTFSYVQHPSLPVVFYSFIFPVALLPEVYALISISALVNEPSE